MKRIAVCIDDYGLHPAIDDAVLELARRGRVTDTSCMVGAPAWAADSARLREFAEAGRIGAGVHVDFTEHPIDPKMRAPVNSWMLRSTLRQVDADAVRAELCRQLDRFEADLGRPPSHVDGHQHVHQFPIIRDVLMDELARRYAGGQRPWVRSTKGAARWRLKGRMIEAMGARSFEQLAEANSFAHNRSLLGVYDFSGGPQRFRELLQQWLASAQDGDLLMCHVANSEVPGDEIAAARADEFAVFSQDDFDSLFSSAEVRPTLMSDIVNA